MQVFKIGLIAAALGLAGCASNHKFLTTRSMASDEYSETANAPEPSILQAVTFNGKPGVTTVATIMNNGEESEPSLVISHVAAGEKPETAVVATKLGVYLPGAKNEPTELAVARDGSLQVIVAGKGKDIFKRVLTVSYVKDQYVLSAFTLDYKNTVTGKKDVCHYNLLTGNGKHNRKKVRVPASVTALADVQDSETLYHCKEDGK